MFTCETTWYGILSLFAAAFTEASKSPRLKTDAVPAIFQKQLLASEQSQFTNAEPAPVLEKIFLQQPAARQLDDCGAATFDVLAFPNKSIEISRLMK